MNISPASLVFAITVILSICLAVYNRNYTRLNKRLSIYDEYESDDSASYFSRLRAFFKQKETNKAHFSELMNVLLNLDDESLEKLLKLYRKEFGDGAARYARQTYRKWEKGTVRPQKRTFNRFLVHLPKVMSYDLKCEVLRHLMEEYCQKDHYDLRVYTDDWEKTLEPLVKKIIDKPYNAVLPKHIEEKLRWLADDETQIAENILKNSQVEEGKLAVSMLRQEFSGIENILASTRGRRRITHQMKFPYGTINLEIRKR